MKTFAAAACLVAAASAWDPEFMRGAQTGFFLSGEDQFEDYSCPRAEIAPQVQTYIDMAKPMQMMMRNMNQGEETPMLDFAFDSVQSFGCWCISLGRSQRVEPPGLLAVPWPNS